MSHLAYLTGRQVFGRRERVVEVVGVVGAWRGGGGGGRGMNRVLHTFRSEPLSQRSCSCPVLFLPSSCIAHLPVCVRLVCDTHTHTHTHTRERERERERKEVEQLRYRIFYVLLLTIAPIILL